MPKKKNFSKVFVYYGTFLRYIYISFHKKGLKEVKKNYKLRFSHFFCLFTEGSGYKIMTDPDPGGPKTYGSGPGSTTLEREEGGDDYRPVS
jgi:hypothetical protein